MPVSQKLQFALGWLLTALLAAGCGGPEIRARRHADRGLAVVPTSALVVGGPGAGRLLEAAARRLEEARSWGQKPEAAGPARDAALLAVRALEAGSPAGPAMALHNEAVGRLIRATCGRGEQVEPAWREILAAQGVVVEVTNPSWAEVSIDDVWVAADYRVSGLELESRGGLGVPLIVLDEVALGEVRPGQGRFFPQRLRLAATGVLRPASDGTGLAVLAIHDPLRDHAVATGRYSWPLASDLTTPLAHQFLQNELSIYEYTGLLNPDSLAEKAGVYLQRPHEPGRIPVLLIHGLWSSPRTWLTAINELTADPLLRERYEFWVAGYPTGYPIGYSAQIIRSHLQEIHATLDPAGTDPALNNMVVVGHSMGGVITKALVSSSGSRLWDVNFRRPPGQVLMSPEDEAAVRSTMFFEPVPQIRRAVFLSAPHRGSVVASRVAGRASSLLVHNSRRIEELRQRIVDANGPDVAGPGSQRRILFNGIDNLEPTSPSLNALLQMPINPTLPYHSIIGVVQLDRPGYPIEEGGDLVVPYQSAHLDGAESETVVPQNHFCTSKPDVIAEIRRILRLHLGVVE